MSAPSSTVDKVRRRLADLSTTNPLAEDYTVLDEAITAAVTRYSQDRPRRVVEDEAGNGTPYYVLVGAGALLTSWVDGFSRIAWIEYPAAAVSATHAPTYLQQPDDWVEDYQDASKTYLRLLSVTPTASETLRIAYTAPHSHTDASDTIPTGDVDALCDLAAHYACLALATKMAASQDSLISADSTNYRDGQLRFKQQAEEWLKSYQSRIGQAASGTSGASATADWDRGYQNSRLTWLTHHPRWR